MTNANQEQVKQQTTGNCGCYHSSNTLLHFDEVEFSIW